jgi:hypothetical protein
MLEAGAGLSKRARQGGDGEIGSLTIVESGYDFLLFVERSWQQDTF